MIWLVALAASTVITPPPVVPIPMVPPPLPHPVAWYMTCAAVTARWSASKGSTDDKVLVDVKSNCGFIAEKAAARMTADVKSHLVDPRNEREFNVRFADTDTENQANLETAADIRAKKITAMVRSENGK